MSKFKKYSFKIFLLIVIRFLELFIKIDKNSALFGSGFGKFSDNSKYLFLYMFNNSYKNIYFITDNKIEYEKYKDNYPFLYKWSYKTFITVLRSNYFFYTHNIDDIYPVKRKSTIAVNLWHGTAIKKSGFDSEVEMKWIRKKQKLGLSLPYERMDYFITAHKNCNRIFQSSMRIEDKKIIASGLPRNDFLFENKSNLSLIEKLKDTIYKSSEKKTILYAPTFRDYESSTIENNLKELMNLFEKLSLSGNILVGIRMHPLEKKLLDVDIFKNSNILDLTKYDDMQEILLATDVLITDYSSMIFDYSILERPVLLYAYDLLEYQQARGGFYFDFEKDFSGYGISENIDTLEKHLNNDNFFINIDFYKNYNVDNASFNILSKFGFDEKN